jgi:hypothetical protein
MKWNRLSILLVIGSIAVVCGALVVSRVRRSQVDSSGGVGAPKISGESAISGARQSVDLAPTRQQQAAASQRAQAGLPVEMNLHIAVVGRVAAEDLETVVANVGEVWGAIEGSGLAESSDPRSHAFMSKNLRGNARVKLVIEMGRSDADRVVPLVFKELANRTARWRKTLQDYDDAIRENGGGYGMSTTGEVVGDMRSKTFSENQHAIPSLVFILANLDQKDGLKAISALVRQIDVVQMPSERPLRVRPGSQELDLDTIFFATALLLQRHPEEDRYANAQRALKTITGDASIATDITVPSARAYWNGQEVPVQAGIIDVSAEPVMHLRVPNEKVLSKFDRDTKAKVFLSVAAADKEVPSAFDLLQQH